MDKQAIHTGGPRVIKAMEKRKERSGLGVPGEEDGSPHATGSGKASLMGAGDSSRPQGKTVCPPGSPSHAPRPTRLDEHFNSKKAIRSSLSSFTP